MDAILSRFSLRYQIGSLVLLSGMIFALTASILWGSRWYADGAKSRAGGEQAAYEQASAVNIALMDARRREKDFLLRKNDEYAEKQGKDVQAAFASLDSLAAAAGAGDEARARQIATVKTGVMTYGDTFNKVVTQYKMIGLTEKEGLMGTLRNSVHRIEDALGAYDDLRLTVLMLQMRRNEKDFFARLDQKYVDELNKHMDEFAKALSASSIPSARREEILTWMKSYQSDFGAASGASLLLSANIKTLSDVYAAVDPDIQAFMRQAADRLSAANHEAEEIALTGSHLVSATMLGGFFASLVIGGLIARSIYRPLGSITNVMEALVQGNRTIAIPATHRRDEIGEMARSVQVFKEAMVEAEQLRHAQEQERVRSEAEKTEALQSMAETVETETRSAVKTISVETVRLGTNIASMADAASSVGQDCQSVAAAASQALANAQTVASAAEELTASIREIADRMANSVKVTDDAVGAASHAQTTIEQLSTAVEKIGAVAQLINGIAGQTNLLALNATIEAARAGEAGKGFAVVANEVKSLANQTAKATGEISAQISEIQTVTVEAVKSVREITDAIREVGTVSVAVSAAVEEQQAATNEIARNVAQTSDAAEEVARRIARVAEKASDTGERAEEVRGISANVSDNVTNLQHVVIRVVRTATEDVDRRKLARYHLACAGKLGLRGDTFDVRIEDCSEEGLSLTGAIEGIRSGDRVEIEVAGVAQRLPAVVGRLEKDGLHAQFNLDAASGNRWSQDFARLVAGRRPLAAVA